MTTAQQPATCAADLVDAANRIASISGILGKSRPNDFGGLDYDNGRVRIIPIDGEWDVGVEVYVFTPTGVVLADARLGGIFSPNFIVRFAANLYRETAE